MTVDPGIIIGAAGCLLTVLLALAVSRAQTHSTAAAARAREECEARQLAHAARISGLESKLGSVETRVRDADEILRHDSLNHSARARALQLLRTGISPDSAAASLGMPRQELRLLSKVSRLLGAGR
ncbi:MAG: hypothetical protein M3N54_08460 [Acidobacteriota bacterium]|nr:hypothetical protein [Acidobacteriota bacterium]